MKWRVVIALGVLGAFNVSTPAQAEVVHAATLNCRSAPATTAPVVATFRRGDNLTVVGRSGAWARVLARTGECWVTSRLLASAAPAASSGNYSYGRSTARSSARSRPSRVTRPGGGQSTGSYGGSCPCSSGRVCIGPRGGRYCITRGGNRRYGV